MKALDIKDVKGLIRAITYVAAHQENCLRQ